MVSDATSLAGVVVVLASGPMLPALPGFSRRSLHRLRPPWVRAHLAGRRPPARPAQSGAQDPADPAGRAGDQDSARHAARR